MDRLAQLHAVDPATLTEIVRQDQRSPSFEIAHWSVQPLSDRGFVATDGLWCFSGEGRDESGARSWSVAVKSSPAKIRSCPRPMCAIGSENSC